MSSSSNPESSESSSSLSPGTLSPMSMTNLLGMTKEDKAENNIHLFGTQPYLIVREHPMDKYRFRYKSEMMGSHGCMLGRSSDKRKKSSPAVELMNFEGPAVIRCSLYTSQEIESARTYHCHRLVIKVGKDDVDDPHEIHVNDKDGYIAKFHGMGIIHTAKKNITEELVRKKQRRLLEHNKALNINVKLLSQNEEVKIRAEAEREARTMDLNVVSLGFEAFVRDSNGILIPICEPVFSDVVRNMKSALTGELKICRIDRHFSTCVGGDEVWMLVEKVGKKNIKVKFYELDDDDNEIWYDFGKFSELDVHHQYAIVFRTPPYRILDVDAPKEVLVQLYRPTDGSCSEPITFIYMPSDKFGLGEASRKRQRVLSNLPLPVNVVNPVTNGLNFDIPNLTNEFQDASANPMFACTAEDNDVLVDLEMMSVSSLTLEQALNDDGLNSAEFKSFMRDESFEGYLGTYSGWANNEMDLATDSGAPKKPSPKVLQTPPSAKPSTPAQATTSSSLEATSKPASQGASLPTASPTANKQIASLPTTSPTKSPQDMDVLKISLLRLLQMMTMKPMPSPSAICQKIREVFEMRTGDGDAALHFAVRPENKRYFDNIKVIFLRGQSIQSQNLHDYFSKCINPRNKFMETPLNRAVFFDQPDTVATLLRCGACPNMADVNGFTPLHIALNRSHNECVRALLDKANYEKSSKKLYLSVNSEDSFSPLHMAARKKNLEAVKLLVAAGADINERNQTNGGTPLHVAIEEECVEIVRFLVSQPTIRVNEPNFSGNTALHMACVAGGVGSLELCAILVDANANPRIPNCNREVNSEDDTDSQNEVPCVVVKQEPGAEQDEIWEQCGQTSLDLAADNREANPRIPNCNREVNSEEDTDSQNKGPCVVVKEEPGAEQDEIWEQCGQTSLDLASDNREILELLQESELPRARIKEEPKENKEPTSSGKDLFDVDTFTELCAILDRTGAWKQLAQLLDYSFLNPVISNNPSPSKVLFNYVDIRGNMSVEQIRDYLSILGETVAVKVIDEMLARRFAAIISKYQQ